MPSTAASTWELAVKAAIGKIALPTTSTTQSTDPLYATCP
jgi:PIN domain nuclease of toxin-antitoxin system